MGVDIWMRALASTLTKCAALVLSAAEAVRGRDGCGCVNLQKGYSGGGGGAGSRQLWKQQGSR